MKVILKSSWCHAETGKIYPDGTELDIKDKFFNEDYHEKKKAVKKAAPKNTK